MFLRRFSFGLTTCSPVYFPAQAWLLCCTSGYVRRRLARGGHFVIIRCQRDLFSPEVRFYFIALNQGARQVREKSRFLAPCQGLTYGSDDDSLGGCISLTT
jgi:hypothetical protein